MDALIGRDEELRQLRGAVAPGRLVVVSGPPGVGKTALLRAALDGREHVLWVELEGARTTNDLWAGLGRALGLSLTDPTKAHDRLVRVLREVAIVALDAADRLDEPAWTALGALRRDRPEVAWVVAGWTARPEASAALQLAPLRQDDARALLVARASAQSLGRRVDEDDPSWRILTERLDGLPLAIELAAGRLALLSPRQLVDRLEVAVLRGVDRRTSVEGALRSCWDLLTEADQQALVRLSMFRGFTVELAEVALGPDALATLERLRSRSALTSRDGRLFVLEGLRAIAVEQVDGAARASFATFWADRVRTVHRRYHRAPHQLEATRLLRDEEGNLRAALEVAVAVGDDRAAVVLARELVLALRHHGPLWRLTELPDPLRLAASVGGEEGADLLSTWGTALLHLGRVRAGRESLEQAIAMSASEGPASVVRSVAYVELGWLAFGGSDREGARATLGLALGAAPDPLRAAMALNALGLVAHAEGDHVAAVGRFEEALVQLERQPSVRMRAGVRTNLGLVRAEQGRLVEASDLLRAAADDLVDQDAPAHANTVQALGLVALVSGDLEQGGACLDAAHRVIERHGGEPARGRVALARALERWSAGDRSAARERLVEAAARLRDLPTLAAEVRALRAALEADAGRAESLAVELEAAGAAGASPTLLALLAAFGGGAVPEPEPIEALTHRVVRRLVDRGPPALRCDRGGRWFERPGDRVDLARRGALQRILAALIEARVTRPGEGLSVHDLFDAGWPGDKALPDAAAARVYTAVRELRSLGVGEVLRREAKGYLLDPAARIDVRA